MGQPAPGRPRPFRAPGPVRSRRRRIGSNTWPSGPRPGCCWAGRPRRWPTPAKPAASSAARPTIAWRSGRCWRPAATTQLQLDRPEDVALLPLRGARLDADLRAAAAALEPIAAAPRRGGIPRGADAGGHPGGAGRVAGGPGGREPGGLALAVLGRGPARPRPRPARGRRSGGGRRRRSSWNLATVNRDHPGLLELRGYLKLAAGDAAGRRADSIAALSLGARDGIHLGKAAALLRPRDCPRGPGRVVAGPPSRPRAARGLPRPRADVLPAPRVGPGTGRPRAGRRLGARRRPDRGRRRAVLPGMPAGRRDRLPRLLVHVRRALDGFWHSLDERSHLAAGLD